MRKLIVIAAVSMAGLTANPTFAQTDTVTKVVAVADTMKGNVINALNSNADYTTAASAVKTANLEADLKTGGPYTIFAPNNAAFSKLSPGKLDSLMKDNGKFSTLLKSHIVTGRYGKADIIKALKAGKGKATLTTLNGQPLQLSISPTKKLQLTTADGVTAEVILYDLLGNNGIVNGIDAILLPGNSAAAAHPKS
ncbi:fasciclin domain-containing protein [Mucilaginibacter sp. UYCu711]|uniref:fasciclin domain-containing protein n=1 Tax=Mucilaginibacter sp. UYCu711 TaxID=3156339 RepID=UPI003D20F880